MEKFKGISKSLELFIGLIILLFILIITFKLLGIWAAYEYEQQAQITAKRLQTAMNFVCASGESTEVEINLPQKLSPRGSETNPIALVWSTFTLNVKEVADAMRYMLALRSYGDPWYVIYFERFPEGEDSGWSGWDEIVAMRTTSMFFRAFEVVSCVIPFSLNVKDMFNIRKWPRLAKKGVKKAASLAKEIRESTTMVRTRFKTISKIKKIREIARVNRETAEKLFSKEFSKVADKIKASSDDVFRWIISHRTDSITNHFGEVGKVKEVADSLPILINKLKKGPKLGSELGEELNEIAKKADKITRGDINNREVKEYIENIKNFNIPGSYLAEDMSRFKNLLNEHINYLREDQFLYLHSLADKIGSGNVPTYEEVRYARNIIEKYIPRNQKAFFTPYIDEIEGYTGFRKIAEDIDLDNIIDDTKPWSWSRAFYEAELDKASIYGLPGISITKRDITKALISKEAQRAYSRWGTWYIIAENPVFSFSDALSLADIAMLKFAPCGENTLCLKSQVNPSIAIYPLKECEKEGIEYIELDKFAEKTDEFEEEGGEEINVKKVGLPQEASVTGFPSPGRAFLSCVENSYTHKIYCFGGESGAFMATHYFDQIVEFSPYKESVIDTKYPTVLIPGRSGMGCAEDSSKHVIYCFGGYDGTNYINRTIKYVPKDNLIYSVAADDEIALAGLSCAEDSSEHVIYCFGGVGESGYSDIIFRFDPKNNLIQESTVRLPSPRAYLSCVENSATHKIYCFGGIAEDIIDDILVFDGSNTEKRELKTPYKVYGLSCAEDSKTHKIYCFGGITENGETNKIFEYMPPKPIFQEAKGVHSWASSPYTRFYTASPCEGKVEISKGYCRCNLVKKPYIDFTSQNVITFDCVAYDVGNVICNITKYLDYSNEEIELGEKVTLPFNFEQLPHAYKVSRDINILNYDEIYKSYYDNSPDFREFYDNLASEGYLNCTEIIGTKFPEKFSCRFVLPEIPFNITKCVRDELVLNCTEWIKIGETKIEVPGIEGTKKEDAWEWCCKKWIINELKSGNKKEISKIDGDVYSNKDCIHDENEINNALEELGLDSNTKEGAKKIILENSIVPMKKDLDLTDPNTAKEYGNFFLYGLDNNNTIVPCLKVKFYTKPETKGFCYTAPPDNELAKEIFYTGLAIAGDIGISKVLHFALKGFGPFGYVASIAGCEIGNLIAWYGQYMITEDREKRIWPNNPYFANYFIE
jgi:hypothetical protein